MRISMWMIANMLRDNECILNISASAQSNLYGVGFAEAPGRACIRSEGNDVVIVSGDSSITIVNCSLIYGFDIVTEIFHMYNDWHDSVLEFCRSGKWQEIVDYTQTFYPNPIVLFDSNLKVMSMSGKFTEGSVDDEWDFLLKYGVASNTAVAAGRSRHRFTETLHRGDNVFYTEPTATDTKAYLSIAILCNTLPWGYLSSPATVCPVEKGAVETLTILSKLISNILIETTDTQDVLISNNNIFQQCFLSPDVDVKSMQNFLEYYSYSGTDTFAVMVSSFLGSRVKENLKKMYSALINTINLPIFIIDDTLVTILTVSSARYSEICTTFKYLTDKFNAITVTSLPLPNVRNVYYAYNQCKFVLNRVNQENSGYYSFYDYAIDYLILNSDRNTLLNACNQEILSMFRAGDKQLETAASFEVYLRNERSLLLSAQQLGIHKNTVLYRVQNVIELTGLDVNNRYDREYALITFAVLRALGQ